MQGQSNFMESKGGILCLYIFDIKSVELVGQTFILNNEFIA